jgi:predicted RNase H-like HicB family nuclease
MSPSDTESRYAAILAEARKEEAELLRRLENARAVIKSVRIALGEMGWEAAEATRFTAVFEEIPESDGGGYLARIEELPEVITEGDTLEEARKNLRDALALVLEDNRERLAKSASSDKKLIKETITVPAA